MKRIFLRKLIRVAGMTGFQLVTTFSLYGLQGTVTAWGGEQTGFPNGQAEVVAISTLLGHRQPAGFDLDGLGSECATSILPTQYSVVNTGIKARNERINTNSR